MPASVSLLFGVHAHQPAGNFPEVVEHAHRRCYQPFLRTLADYPAFRFAVHFSGPLLDDLAARFPDDIALLRTMVARGQVELFGAGDAEPVLAAIPHRDRLSQITALSRKLAERFGARPQGAWLTERVWESSVVPALVEAGIRYVTVDDYHFLCTGVAPAALCRHYTTEEDGRTLDVFPISEALRYRIPFAPAAEAVAYLEGLAQAGGRVAAVYFDDIEKLGVWPETHEWVYERGWLREFVERVLASQVLATQTYADWAATERTAGIVYLPTTSYIEMNEWTLPAAPAGSYATLVAGEKAAGRYEAHKGFLRGGIWRNFLSRYPESNWMHKRMLGLSARLAALPPTAATPPLQHLLHLAQANDAYWHGLFGGLYLPHLRRGVWSHLLQLEGRLDALAPRPAVERGDLDCDGVSELFLRTPSLQAVVRGDGTAALRELASYPLAQNFGDTLRRHAEHYHRRVEAGAGSTQAGEGIASAHDRVTFKHPIGPADVVPEPLPRDALRDAWLDAAGRVFALDGYAEAPAPARKTPAAAFTATVGTTEVGKRIELRGDAVIVRWSLRGGPGTFRTTLDLAMPSCDGMGGRYLVDGAIVGGFGATLALPANAALVLDDRHMGGSVTLACTPPAAVAARPYHTVSQSEEGFERIMQSATVEIAWPVAAGDTTLELALRIATDAR